jgi:magnesium-transporting ATPase (P-type)
VVFNRADGQLALRDYLLYGAIYRLYFTYSISLVLSILTAFLTFLLGVGTTLLYIVMTICVFVAFGSFFMLHDTKAAIEALIIRFLLSPYGLPMIGATIIAFIELINKKIKAV